jgi:putative transposase
MIKKQILPNNQSDLDSFKRPAIEKIYQGKPLTGKNGIFSDMIKEILETALSEELNQHLKREKQEFSNDFNNRKNGFNSKTLKTRESAFTLGSPRDRNGSFEPQIIKKGQTVLTQELVIRLLLFMALAWVIETLVLIWKICME